MFQRLIEKIKELGKGRKEFDPSEFNDPVAMTTSWGPAKGGGANFCTHRLKQVSSDRYVFRIGLGAILFSGIFLCVGLAVAFGVPILMATKGTLGLNPETFFPIGFGFIFAAVGGCMLYFFSAPIIFDKLEGYYWKGRTAPDSVYDPSTLKNCCQLSDIHAIQIIREYCRGDKSSYYSYELNLVLKDGNRLNVIDHGALDKLRDDAAALAEFLGVPIWDIA